MKNILNLIKMQLIALIALKKTIFIIFGISLVMSITNPTFITFSSTLLLMAVCYNPAFYEEKSRNSYLVHSLPIKPSDFILAKFLYCGLISIIAMIVTAIEYIILDKFNIVIISEIISLKQSLLMVLLIGVFTMAILIPASLIIGFEKGRYILFFLMVGPICFTPTIVEYLPKINLSGITGVIIGILITITVIITSFFITSNLYSKKEVI